MPRHRFIPEEEAYSAEWVGFTWHWYNVLLHDEDMLAAGKMPAENLVSLSPSRNRARCWPFVCVLI